MMKKTAMILLSIVLISALMTTSAYAAGAGSFTVSPANPQPGDQIVATFSIAGLGQVSALAMEFDVPAGLKLIKAEWLVEGKLKDVDASTCRAVLAFGSNTDLTAKTDVFAVTYEVLENVDVSYNAPFTTTVTMELQSKLESASMDPVTVTQEIKVTVSCDHPADQQEIRNKTEATCNRAGYTGDTWCKECNTELKKGSAVAATGKHAMSDTWQTDAENHWHVCTSAGCGQMMDVAAHTFQWVTDKEPTEDSTGLKHEECGVCGMKRNENTVIDKLTHQHIGITRHAAVAATCTTEGNVEYWTCSSAKCSGKYYSDSNCSKTLTSIKTPADANNHTGGTEVRGKAEATCAGEGYTGDTYCKGCQKLISKGTVIPATGNHVASKDWKTDGNNHWHICTNAGCTQKMDVAAHTFQWVTDKAPTEDGAGLKHEECGVCGLKRNENTAIDQLPHQHTGINHHAAVAATCTTEGNVEYWTCSSAKCSGKYYGDSSCSKELTSITTPADDNNHTGGTEVRSKVDATCASEGYTGDTCCAGCGAVLSSGRVIAATGKHNAGSVWYFDGTSHWKTCANNGCGQKVEQADHTYTWVVDKPATETADGVKHEECKCGSKRSENSVIPKLNHTHTGIRHYERVPATCVATGTVEYWTCSHTDCAGKCYGDSACQVEINTIVEPVSKNQHTGDVDVRNVKAATCGTDGYTGDVYCGSCDALISKGEVVVATGKHTPKAEYLQNKSHHWKVCATCNAVIGNAKQPHTFTWVVDKVATESATGLRHQECTACGYRTNENTVIDRVPHAQEFVAAKPSTCTEDGVVEHFYCAGCGKYFASENGRSGKQITREDTMIPASGHTYLEQWLSDENGHWHLCGCGEQGEYAEHQIEVLGAVDATGSIEGYTGDAVCQICRHTVAEGEVIPVITDETEPVAEPEEQVPAATEPVDPGQEGRDGVNPLVIVVIVVVLTAIGAAAGVVVVQKKRKK